MGISDWRAKRHMKYPVRGVLRVTGFHEAHRHSSSHGAVITGVITAPGILATPVEHKTDEDGRWTGARELPVLVDQADPSRFVILWDEARDFQAQDFQAQAEADRVSFGPGGARR